MSEPTHNHPKVRREGRCRICPAVDSLTKHHIVPERWFNTNPTKPGRNSQHNLVPLCRYCHAVIDAQLPCDNDRSERSQAKRSDLRRALLPDEIRFVDKLRGRLWLDHHYPLDIHRHNVHL